MPETQKTLNALQTVEWGEQHFGSLVTNRQFPRRRMESLERRGLVRCIGFVEISDADGGTIPGRAERPGWVLTDAGKAALAKENPDVSR